MNDPNEYGTWQEGIFAQYKPKYICDSCEKYPCSADETKLMLTCPAYSPKPKPITNADRIRSMTDEELADEILKWFNWLNAVEWDEDRIINWLKQEA